MKKLILLLPAALSIFISCSQKKNPVVIWTDSPDLVSYVEVFNNTQDKTKAIVVFKEKVADSLPAEKNEIKPDIVIGKFLKNSRMKKNFSKLNSVFGRETNPNKLHRENFYKPLLDFGEERLLPVSFNLPLVIFHSSNSDFVSKDYMMNPNEIRDDAGLFNTKNKNGIYTKMGFAPSWNKDFLYLLSKMNRANFSDKDGSFSWNEYALEQTVDYIVDWTLTRNTASSNEDDFQFKYLYTPSHKQVESGKCLFAYSDSKNFLTHPQELISDLDFRWISSSDQEPKIFVEDEITLLGLYKKSSNKANALKFITWLLEEDTQKKLLERSEKMNLGVRTFGICGGFSSIKSMNEEVFPTYYKNLLGNLPYEDLLEPPDSVPARWLSIKERVIIPYLAEKTKTETLSDIKTIEERLNSWYKQFN